MNKVIVSTRIEEQTFKTLNELARREDRKLAYMVRRAVEQFVKGGQKGGRNRDQGEKHFPGGLPPTPNRR